MSKYSPNFRELLKPWLLFPLLLVVINVALMVVVIYHPIKDQSDWFSVAFMNFIASSVLVAMAAEYEAYKRLKKELFR